MTSLSPLSTARALGLGLLVWLGGAVGASAGLTMYTDRGHADFDVFIQSLNPYGTWSKIDGTWAWTPFSHETPYTHGRWLYTEFGWLWKGDEVTSWATDHYGYWKRGTDKVWSWYPLPIWLPMIVEIRQTKTHIGWRSAAVDRDGSFVEEPADRYTKTDEWTFVTRDQFTKPITPAVIATPQVAEQQLEDSTDCMHDYFTYRAIERPGPHPADFVAIAPDGGMFPSMLQAERLAAMPKPTVPILPPDKPILGTMSTITLTTTSTSTTTTAGTNVAAKAPPIPADPLAGIGPGTKAAAGEPPVLDDSGNPVDTRQVKYWITMSLPDVWAKAPPDAKQSEVYLYRPDIYQDEDGIARRITYWIDPKAKTPGLRDIIASGAGGNATPGATPKARDPFHNGFDDTYHPHASSAAADTTNEPAATPAEPVPTPDGTATNAHKTNAAPSGRAQ